MKYYWFLVASCVKVKTHTLTVPRGIVDSCHSIYIVTVSQGNCGFFVVNFHCHCSKRECCKI